MLATTDIKKISTVFGLSADDFNKALKSETEVALNLPDAYETVKTNLRASGIEIGIKSIYKELGISYVEGDKTPERAKEVIKGHYDAQLADATQKVTELTTQLKEKGGNGTKLANAEEALRKLRATHDKLQKDTSKQIDELTTSAFNQKRKAMLLSAMGDEELSMDKEDLLIVLQSKLNIVENESGNLVVKQTDGTYVQDDLGTTLPADKVVSKLVKETYVGKGRLKTEKNHGEGGGSFDDILIELKEEGIDAMSEKGQARLAEAL